MNYRDQAIGLVCESNPALAVDSVADALAAAYASGYKDGGAAALRSRLTIEQFARRLAVIVEIEELEGLVSGTMLACPCIAPHAYYCACKGSGLESREERLTILNMELDKLHG